VSGIVLGSVYGIVPIVLREWQYSLEQISTVMSLIIIGGMVFQYPVGKLSDGIGRQTVLLMVAVGALSLTLFSLIAHEVHCYRGFVWLNLLWGGTLFTLYPLSMNLACDRVASDDLLASTGGLMLAYSLGASVGPFMAAFVVKIMGGMGLYLLFSGVLAVVVGWASRCPRVGLPSGSRQKPYANLPLHNGISPAIARAFSRLKGNKG
jgi:MFS family permease